MQTATAVENGGMKDIPPPSMDIFKAIFEDNDDDESDSTEDEIEDQQESNKNEALEGHPHGWYRNKILGKEDCRHPADHK